MLHIDRIEEAPRRRRKPPTSPLEHHKEFQDLLAYALAGKLGADKMAWIAVEQKKGAKINLPRVMVDTLRRAFRAQGLLHLKPLKYRNDSGQWIVGIRHVHTKSTGEGSAHRVAKAS